MILIFLPVLISIKRRWVKVVERYTSLYSFGQARSLLSHYLSLLHEIDFSCRIKYRIDFIKNNLRLFHANIQTYLLNLSSLNFIAYWRRERERYLSEMCVDDEKKHELISETFMRVRINTNIWTSYVMINVSKLKDIFRTHLNLDRYRRRSNEICLRVNTRFLR